MESGETRLRARDCCTLSLARIRRSRLIQGLDTKNWMNARVLYPGKKSRVRALGAPTSPGAPRRAVIGMKKKKKKGDGEKEYNVGQEEGVYLVLRVCRACNHRGTAKRPSTPSHSASRAILFSSLLARAPSVVPGAHTSSLFPGPRTSPLSRAARWSSLFLLSAVSPSHAGASSRRCAHSMIIIGFRSWTADARRAAPLSLSLFPFSFSFLRLFVSLVAPVYPRISRSRVPNSAALNYGWTDDGTTRARAPTFPPVLLVRRAENLTRRKFITETRARAR